MIPPGTKITCPKCNKLAATTLGFVELGVDGCLYHDDFHWEDPISKVKGGKCLKCKTNYSDTGGWIHTENGWEEV